MKHSSTNDAVIDAYNEFLLNLNKKTSSLTCAMFLDLSKAFDCLAYMLRSKNCFKIKKDVFQEVALTERGA